MPGVPSGRGCNACRRQKKKCDQSQPACSRCARLKIACEGGGQQRYVFKNQSVALVPSNSQPADGVVSPLGNEMTMLAGAFSSMLQIRDLRFDLRIYGTFLQDIPKRLGTNDALDASVRAMSAAFAVVHTRQQSLQMYESYGEALKVLRACLNDPAKAREPNTLCAVYLVMICQGWLGKRDDPRISHSEIIAYLLTEMASRNWQGGFEANMLVTLRVIVMIQAFLNPKIHLDPRLWDDGPEHCGPLSPIDHATSIQSLKLRNIVKLIALVRSFEAHIPEIQSAYRGIRADCVKMSCILSTNPNTTFNIASDLAQFVYICYQSSYGTLLCLVLLLNASIRANGIVDSSLVEDSSHFVNEAITLAEKSSKYRPLGSSSIPLCLAAAWAVTDDAQKQTSVEKTLADWQTDFGSTRWLDLADVWRDQVHTPGWIGVGAKSVCILSR